MNILLAAQFELFDYLPVALDVVFLEIPEKPPTLANHFHQPVS